jgi:uncharacterized damage-inducible protein DinB
MRSADIRTLYDYNYWANEKLLNQAEHIPHDLFPTAELGYCNLRDTLYHILEAESIWLLRWKGIDPETVKFPEEFPTLAALRDRWNEEKRGIYNFIGTLTDADLDSTITYPVQDNQTFTRILWQVMVHVVNHGTQHRSEAAMVLTDMALSPGAMDFSIFIRERGGK